MIRIITDSSSDLPAELIDAYEIIEVPLNVALEDGTTIQDGVELTNDEFFEHMKACKKPPKTSQPTPEAFAKIFEEAKAAGDEVIAILISNDISGTYQSASIGKQIAHAEDVYLVDSRTLCASLALLVLLAADLRDRCFSAEEIVAKLEHAKEHVHLFAVVDNLKYLHKGGRLPAAAAVAGSMLGIKPIITIKDGKVTLGGKARGLPGAHVNMFKQIDALGGINTKIAPICAYTVSKQEIEPLQHYLSTHLKINKPITAQIGSTIGTHTGPGCFGFAFFDKGLEI